MATWDEVSTDHLAAAQLLMETGHHRSSVSRAYYAMYTAITAALVMRGLDNFGNGRQNPSHETAMNLLEHHLTPHRQPSERREVVRQAKTVRRYREIADYIPGLTVDTRIARDSIRSAAFVRGYVQGAQR